MKRLQDSATTPADLTTLVVFTGQRCFSDLSKLNIEIFVATVFGIVSSYTLHSKPPVSSIAMDTVESGPAFHQYFKQRVNDVQNQIESLSRPDLPSENRKGVTENILASLTKLSAALADTSSSLASYDQRSYNQVGQV